MPITLDNDLATERAVGARRGLSPDALSSRRRQLPDLVRRVEQAAEAGLLPPVALARDPDGVRAHLATGASWREEGRRRPDRVVVLGEPGACAAVTMLALSVGCRDLVVIDQPDRAQVAHAFDGAKRPRLVVLGGPEWVGTLAAAVRPAASSALHYTEDDDTAVLADADAERVVAAGSCDPRFAPIGAASLALAGWAGVPADPLVETLQQTARRAAGLATRDNVALRLGVMANELETACGLATPILLCPGPALARWGHWASRTWAAIRCRSVPVESGFAARGGAPIVLSPGDEALIQRTAAGPRDHWTLALQPGGDDDLLPLSQQLIDAHVRQQVRGGRPVIRLQLPSTAPDQLAAISLLWMHAALFATALDPVDPLTMDAADDWRSMLSAQPTG